MESRGQDDKFSTNRRLYGRQPTQSKFEAGLQRRSHCAANDATVLEHIYQEELRGKRVIPQAISSIGAEEQRGEVELRVGSSTKENKDGIIPSNVVNRS